MVHMSRGGDCCKANVRGTFVWEQMSVGRLSRDPMSCLPLSRCSGTVGTGSTDLFPFKTKFHYAIQLASRSLANSITLSSSVAGSRAGSRAGLRPASGQIDLLQDKFHYVIQVADLVSDLSQTGSGHIPLRYPAR